MSFSTTTKCMYATTSMCTSGGRDLSLDEVVLVHGTKYSCKPCFIARMDGAASSAARKTGGSGGGGGDKGVPPRGGGGMLGDASEAAVGGGGPGGGAGGGPPIIEGDPGSGDVDAGKSMEQLKKELVAMRRALLAERAAHKQTIDALLRFCDSSAGAMRDLGERAEAFSKPFLAVRELR